MSQEKSVKTKKRRKRKFSIVNLLLILVLAVSIGAGVYAAANIFKTTEEIKQSDESYEYVLGEASHDDYVGNIDFEVLKTINPDVVGWIKMENTPINYPVVYNPEKGDYYLKHLFTGEYNNAGCLFIDVHNKSDMSDRNTVIYGHNMHNGSMFAALEKYKDPSFYQTHKELYYYTSDGRVFRLEPFAGYITTGEDMYVQVEFNTKSSYKEYIDSKIAKSTFQSDVELLPKDKIVTLSTCSYHTNDGRYALFCKSTEITGENQ